MAKQILDIQKKLAKRLNPKRYIHSLGVQYTAAALAMCYGYDTEKAMLAGILHDCAKYLTDEELITICMKSDIPITIGEKRNPFLLHAKVGSYFAKTVYEVKDKEVLDSILNHTTGRPNMTLLCKIIFVADYIEPNRKKIPQLNAIRESAFQNINVATALILRNIVQYLQTKYSSNNGKMDELTLHTYEYYKQYLVKEGN